ncbi:DoxX family protein [Streptomyces sp. NPDC002730]|uniref:DoxX family protein n=1 Tax=Streptomyces sp. NPDC002730 TaxID=3364662 RepID=UPI0036CA8E05
MIISISVLSAFLTVIFATSGIAKVTRNARALERSSKFGFSSRDYHAIGVLELAGAAGLMAGLWVVPLAIAASLGLMLLMAGAVVSHIRIKDPITISFPAVGLGLLAALSTALTTAVA